MKRKVSPVTKPSKMVPATLAALVVIAGFATLMVRLEATQEGYRLSSLQSEIRTLAVENQRLRLDAAQLSSHERLRALAAKHGMRPPGRGQVVTLP
jgi:cell division protein FtsL